MHLPQIEYTSFHTEILKPNLKDDFHVHASVWKKLYPIERKRI